MNYFITIFGATYNCSTYGTGSYNEGAQTNSQTCTDTSGGTLAPTGQNIIYGLGGGILLLTVGAVLLFRTHRRKKQSSQQ